LSQHCAALQELIAWAALEAIYERFPQRLWLSVRSPEEWNCCCEAKRTVWKDTLEVPVPLETASYSCSTNTFFSLHTSGNCSIITLSDLPATWEIEELEILLKNFFFQLEVW